MPVRRALLALKNWLAITRQKAATAACTAWGLRYTARNEGGRWAQATTALAFHGRFKVDTGKYSPRSSRTQTWPVSSRS